MSRDGPRVKLLHLINIPFKATHGQVPAYTLLVPLAILRINPSI